MNNDDEDMSSETSSQDENSNDNPASAVEGGNKQNPAQSSFRACESCRSRKVRCVMNVPGGPCEYCAKHRAQCIQLEPQPKRKRKSTANELKSRVDVLERQQLQDALKPK
ncbi:hypothetical protein PYCC9005_001510 [Savitreella phatthalungensis]